MLIGATEVGSHWSGRSGRDQHLLERLEILEGSQEATHQRCSRDGFSQKRLEYVFHACCFLSFLRMQVGQVLRSPELASMTCWLVDLVNVSLTFASIPIIGLEP